MGYGIEGLIGPVGVLLPGKFPLKEAHLFPLAQGLGLVPLTPGLCAELTSLGPEHAAELPGGLSGLVEAAARWAGSLSRGADIAYVEAEVYADYNVWDQAALIWRGGRVSWGPVKAADAINQALRQLGVVADRGDEFDSVRLGLHRWTESWLGDPEELK